MKNPSRRTSLASRALATVFLSLLCCAAGPAPATEPAPQADPGAKPELTAKTQTSLHDITIAGVPVHYRATAGTLPISDDNGKETARFFYIAYEKIGSATSAPTSTAPTTAAASAAAMEPTATASNATSEPAAEPKADASRPVTFVFNGGPGSASVWLHMGTAGPKRVKLAADGFPPSPPYALTDNAQSWLDITDLVFIDPVGTGFSRGVDPAKEKEFFGYGGDIESVANFIQRYCTKNSRWLSPKFLAGESYGTTRAAGLSEYLHDRYGLDLNGIVFISTVLNFETISFAPGNDMPYPLYLPTYTALAHFHKKLAPDLDADWQKTVADARQWASTEYATDLAKGTSLDDATRRQALDKFARYTGLPREYVDRSDLRVNPFRFEKELLADQRKVIGRYDGRITGDDSDPLNDSAEFDPSADGYQGVFTATFNDYVRRELKYETEATYEVLTPIIQEWDFGKQDHYLNVAPTLEHAIIKIPSMKALFCCGYYDLATPFAATEYTINSLPLSKSLRSNITTAYFEGGHMMYLNPAALEKLKSTLRGFYQASLER
jgi:carboxypeptidase C (cathepsin A)